MLAQLVILDQKNICRMVPISNTVIELLSVLVYAFREASQRIVVVLSRRQYVLFLMAYLSVFVC